MKQGTNVFVIIGLITLACGQLHGLTLEQSAKLDQLKQKLEIRYAKGIPSIEPMEWLRENGEIIEQIEELDFLAASPYKRKQNLFFKKIQYKRKQKKAKKRAETVKLIRSDIRKSKSIITKKVLDSFVQYDHIDFDTMKKLVVEVIDKIKLVQTILTTNDYSTLYLDVGGLMINIEKLLEIKKDNKKLSVDDFNQMARTIRLMKTVFDIRFPSERKKDVPKSIVMQAKIISSLKKGLYDIYEAKQEAGNKITILYDYTWSILGYPFSIRLRSKPQDDLLVAIPPRLEKEAGWGERLTKIVRAWFQNMVPIAA